MAGMYPDDQSIEVFGEKVQWPGMGEDGKFSDGSFSDPQKKPSALPAATINLILDNLTTCISGLGKTPNNTAADQLLNAIVAKLNLKANIASPALSGTPTAPTAATAANNTQIATTAFVQAQKASPVFTGTPQVPAKTSAAGANATLIATEHQVSLKANIASPAFTGAPTAPTASVGACNTQVATTAFVTGPTIAVGTWASFVSTYVNANYNGRLLRVTGLTTANGWPVTTNNINNILITGGAGDFTVFLFVEDSTGKIYYYDGNSATDSKWKFIATADYAHPVGSYYTQYPMNAANDYATAFPAEQRPSSLFGGTWAAMWEGDQVVFKTGGTVSTDLYTPTRSGGLQAHGLPNAEGEVSRSSVTGVLAANYYASGVFYPGGTGTRLTSDMAYSDGARSIALSLNRSNALFGASNGVVMRNRKMIVWRRTA